MLLHIVLLKFKPHVSAAMIQEFRRELEGLLGVVPSLRSVEVSLTTPPSSEPFHLALRTTFDDWAGYMQYRTHPQHEQLNIRLKEATEQRACVDQLDQKQ